jgi:hypothetical protein
MTAAVIVGAARAAQIEYLADDICLPWLLGQKLFEGGGGPWRARSPA